MSSLMGRAMSDVDMIWVVPKVKDIEYPTFTPTDPILVKIFDEEYPIIVEKYEIRNITCEAFFECSVEGRLIGRPHRLHLGLARLPRPDQVGPVPSQDGRPRVCDLLLVRSSLLFHSNTPKILITTVWKGAGTSVSPKSCVARPTSRSTTKALLFLNSI